LSSRGYYNLLPLLLAVRRLRRRLNVDIKLVAAGPILNDYIKRIIESFRDELIYLGLLDVKDVVILLSACDVGVVPRIDDPIYDYSLPIKFYEYVATGLPVIVMANRRSELEVLGDGKQVRSYIHVEDAVEATMIAWRKSTNAFEVYNVASEDWMTVDEVADEVIKAVGLSDVRKIYRPVLHGVGWPGDVKRVALRIDKLKALGFKPSMGSREAVRATAKKLVEELVHNGLAGRASPARQGHCHAERAKEAMRSERDVENY